MPAVSTSCLKKSFFLGYAQSRFMVSPACVQRAFSTIAAHVLGEDPQALPRRRLQVLTPSNIICHAEAPVSDRDIFETPDERAKGYYPTADGEHYQELARGLRQLARLCRLPVTRKELLRLATNYDRRADHFDSRA
jgi:hypothetical protein